MARFRGSTWRFAACAVVGGSLAACSLFVSVDGLEGGDGGANGGDASGSSDGSVDSKSDAAVGDGSIADAGVDSCVFCDDFDDRTSPQGPWDDFTGSPQISGAEYRSAPHSAYFHLDALADGVYGSINLSKTIPLKNSGFTIDFDVKVATDLSSVGGYFNFVNFSEQGDYAGSVTATSTDWATDYWADLTDGGHLQTTFGSMQAPDQNWHHFQYVIVYDAVKGSLQTSIDGVAMGSAVDVMTYGSEPGPSTVGLTIGLGANGPLPGLDVYIDNVAVHY